MAKLCVWKSANWLLEQLEVDLHICTNIISFASVLFRLEANAMRSTPRSPGIVYLFHSYRFVLVSFDSSSSWSDLISPSKFEKEAAIFALSHQRTPL